MPIYTGGSLITPEPWMQDAACVEVDPDLFFPKPGDQKAIKDAQKVCKSCTVLDDCAVFALRERPRHGIWAGMSRHTRDALEVRS